MRILWLSYAPWISYGFGLQTGLCAPRLSARGHDVSLIAGSGLYGQIVNWQGLTVYPGPVYTEMIHSVADGLAQSINADLLVVYRPFQHLRGRMAFVTPWVVRVPFEWEPLLPEQIMLMRHANARIAISRFCERVIHRAGLDCFYVPETVDTAVYAPMDRREARERLGWPQDRFIVGMVAANYGAHDPRKCIPQNLRAFAELRRRHPDTLLYMHTIARGAGAYDILSDCQSLGIADDVIVPDQLQMFLTGFPNEHMAAVYSAINVLLAVSMGEGFGLPVVEAQACGTPVIVGNWTATAETCFAGWSLSPREAEESNGLFMPHVGAITEALRTAYDTLRGGESTQQLSDQARTGAMAYDADHVVKTYWQPTLQGIEQAIHATPSAGRAMSLNLPSKRVERGRVKRKAAVR